MGGNEMKHGWLQKQIYYHPELVGLKKHRIIRAAQEVALMTSGHNMVVPDLHFLTLDNNYYYEVKSGHNHKLFTKGMDQLERILMWHDRNRMVEPEVKLVMPDSDKYRVWADMLPNLQVYQPGDSFRR